jgi:hypothetical protein
MGSNETAGASEKNTTHLTILMVSMDLEAFDYSKFVGSNSLDGQSSKQDR